MPALAIVPHFDEREQGALGLVARREVCRGEQLVLERCEEALGHRVIPAVSFAAHSVPEAMRAEHGAVIVTRVLGGFNRSSQHLTTEVSDDEDRDAEIQSVYASGAAFAGTPAKRTA